MVEDSVILGLCDLLGLRFSVGLEAVEDFFFIFYFSLGLFYVS